jgi:protein-S-isoprenylcysteine O-methyltransferase Ste14
MLTATAAKLIWLAGIAIWIAIRFPFQRKARRHEVAVSTGGATDQVALVIATWGQFLIPLSYVAVSVGLGQPIPGDYPFHPFIGWLGVAALVGSLVLFRLTHKQLGRNWSVTLEMRTDHKLVTDGIYAYVRHPMYTSFLLSAVAQALLLPNIIAGPVGLIAFGVLFFTRIDREEAMMTETFGESYRDYMRRTARIVPGIY